MNLLTADLDYVIEQGAGLWEDLRGASLFVTGGTGFFGCWLLETFTHACDSLGLDASAVVLTRNPAAFASKTPHLAHHRAVSLLTGDVRTFAFPSGRFSHVIHAGMDASTGLDARQPRLMFDMMLGGTARALEFAERAGARRFLFTSSGSVYGRQPPEIERLPEDFRGSPDPADARMMHGEAKRASEMLCALHASERLQPVIARGFAFVGPYLPIDVHFAAGNFIRDALAGGPIRIVGDGTPYRSYLYAADLALWLWTMLLRGTPMRPYNVGSDVAVTIRHLAEVVRDVVAPSVAIEMAGTPVPCAAPSRYVPSVRRAVEELGLTALIPLDRAVERTARWHAQRA
jgi:dTDP-glucose 4,6-dehydratase